MSHVAVNCLELACVLRCRAFDAAFEAYNTALRINPADHNAAVNMGLAYSDIGSTDDAVSLFDAVLMFDPANKQAHLGKSTSHPTFSFTC